jgi:hypothetical protein
VRMPRAHPRGILLLGGFAVIARGAATWRSRGAPASAGFLDRHDREACSRAGLRPDRGAVCRGGCWIHLLSSPSGRPRHLTPPSSPSRRRGSMRCLRRYSGGKEGANGCQPSRE